MYPKPVSARVGTIPTVVQSPDFAVANAFVYFVRYGVVDWIPTYLQTAKGYSFQQSSWAWAAFEETERKRSANSCSAVISFCWFL